MDPNQDYTSHVDPAWKKKVAGRQWGRTELAALQTELGAAFNELKSITNGFRHGDDDDMKRTREILGQLQVLDKVTMKLQDVHGNEVGMLHPSGGATQRGAITYAGSISEAVARAGGLHPAHNPRLTIPTGTLWPKQGLQAAVSYGGAPLGPPQRITEIVPLGQDRRYLYPVLKTNPLSATDAVVQWVTETARTLASASSMVRAIDATSTKPETAATLALTTLTLKQVAHKISAIPNIVFRQPNPDLQGYLNGVLRLGLSEALDYEAIQAVSGASLSTGGTGSTMAERIRKAMTTLESAGYNPDTVVLSPSDSEALDLELLATLNSSNTLPNWSLNVRISKSTTTGLVLDSSVFATLHAGPIELAAFEENFGQSNTVTVRGELNAQVSIDQAGAAVAIGASA